MSIRVAIQGEKGSYSECAALEFFPDCEIVPLRDYAELFSALDDGTSDRMVIPIENSTAGSVYPYYDLLLDYATTHGFRICGERKLRIRHNLIGLPGSTLSAITEARSHFQALDQCRNFLLGRGLKSVPVYDTSGAAMEIQRDNLINVAAVASRQAASDFGMTVLAENIQNQTDNYTRFLSVEKNPCGNSAGEFAKTSVAFCIANVEGSLFRTMAAFGSRKDVNVIRIESRPLSGTSTQWRQFVREHQDGEDKGVWDLVYYVDFVAPVKKVESVITHLEELVMERGEHRALQVLGTYGEGEIRDITGRLWRS